MTEPGSTVPLERSATEVCRRGNHAAGTGAKGIVFFVSETQTDSYGDTTHSRIGFELVEDCRSVYAQIRQIQSTR
jgi:hypothetical protein